MTARARFGALAQRTPLAFAPPVKDASQVELRLYSAIDSWGGDWGTSAAEFAAALDKVPDGTTEIHLHVNSPGGEVYEGLAIMNALRSHPARIIAHVDGLAASAASFIVASADEVVMAPHSELMIHEAHGAAVGPADTMRAMAADLDRISDNLASIYAARAGGDVTHWRDLMRAETWMTAEQAVASGLADRVDGQATTADEATKAQARAALAAFTNSARAAATTSPSTPVGGAESPAITGDTTHEEDAMGFTPEQITKMRAMIGVSQDADEATIVAGIAEALAERAVEQPVNKVPEGMSLVDADTLSQLRADAELGRRAHEEQAQAKREQLVQAAVNDGRIPPARKDHWVTALAVDPGAADVLASLEPGLIPVVEAGHAAEGVISQQDADYTALFGKAGA